MNHDFWFAVFQAVVGVITAAFGAYHGAKKGSSE